MKKIDISLLSGHEVHSFASEQSTCGFRPGEKPPTLIEVPGLGNGQPFGLVRIDEHGSWHYFQSLGCVSITLYND